MPRIRFVLGLTAARGDAFTDGDTENSPRESWRARWDAPQSVACGPKAAGILGSLPTAPAIRRRLSFRAPWSLFWVGFGLRLAGVLIGHTYRIRGPIGHFGFGWEAGRIAQSLATGHGYGNPFNGFSGPTAWLSPLYPLLMALAFKLFGVYSNAAALFLMACDCLFSAAIAPAVYEIAARCFDACGLARRASVHAAPVALWSGWMWAVYPAALQYAVHWIWEMSLSTCLFTWSLVFALRLRRLGEVEDQAEELVEDRDGGQAGAARWHPLRLWSGLGLLWGLLGLSNPSLLLCLPGIIVWVAWPQIRRMRSAPGQPLLRTAGGATLACLVFALVLSPWIVRNELVLHAFIPTRSNGGAELYESMLESHDAFPWGTSLPLWAGAPEFRLFVRLGEVRYARMRGEQAEARIRARPGLYARYTVDRFLFFWDGTPHPPEPHPVMEYLRQLNYASLSACGLLGLALMWSHRAPGAGLFALMFALQPLAYYLVTVQPRFRHPIEPLIDILGVYLFRSAQTGRTFSRFPWRR